MSAYYHSSVSDFKSECGKNTILPKLREAAGLTKSENTSETESWENNAHELVRIIKAAGIPDDAHIALEYSVPVAGRADVILFGVDKSGKNNMIVIELKQWDNQVRKSEVSCRLITAFTGGKLQDVSHPSIQVREYCELFKNYLEPLSNGSVEIKGLAYCYNYDSNKISSSLFDPEFEDVLGDYPLYSQDKSEELCRYLHSALEGGRGDGVYKLISEARVFPTARVLDAASRLVIDPKDKTFILLGDQHIVYQTFVDEIERLNQSPDEKTVLIVKGGPGTGKTILALKMLAEWASKGRSAFYVTPSNALRKQLCEALKDSELEGNRAASSLMPYVWDFRPYAFKENEVDVVIIDEAHRVKERANDQTDGTREVKVEYDGERADSVYCPLSQDLALMYCAKLTVFLIDDKQAIKSGEIGQSAQIAETAKNYHERIKEQTDKFNSDFSSKKPKIEKDIHKLQQELNELESQIINNPNNKTLIDKLGKKNHDLRSLERELKRENCTISIRANVQHVRVIERTLSTQFRCHGAEHLTSWLNEVLYQDGSSIKSRLPKDEYDFDFVDDPEELSDYVNNHSNESEDNNDEEKITARMIAGWCWPWDNETAENGDLKEEIVIERLGKDPFRMRWETKATPRGDFRTKYPRDAQHWATDPRGINQVGCAYSAQGFEFDYVGVILGPDIDYDEITDRLICFPDKNKDKGVSNANGETHIRNIYRVLLTRGRKGCRVYCCNPGVAKFLKRFID